MAIRGIGPKRLEKMRKISRCEQRTGSTAQLFWMFEAKTAASNKIRSWKKDSPAQPPLAQPDETVEP
jgi:hypothetical protein